MYVILTMRYHEGHKANKYIVWPYCAVARRLTSMAMTNLDASAWSNMQWRRQLETFGENDEPVIVTVPGADVDTVW